MSEKGLDLTISGHADENLPTAKEIEDLLPKEYVANWISKERQLDRKVFMPSLEIQHNFHAQKKAADVIRRKRAKKLRRIFSHKSKRRSTKKLHRKKVKRVVSK